MRTGVEELKHPLVVYSERLSESSSCLWIKRMGGSAEDTGESEISRVQKALECLATESYSPAL